MERGSHKEEGMNKTIFYNVSKRYVDDPETNHTLQFTRREIKNRYPWIAHVIDNPEFHSISWVIGLKEVKIIRKTKARLKKGGMNENKNHKKHSKKKV